MHHVYLFSVLTLPLVVHKILEIKAEIYQWIFDYHTETFLLTVYGLVQQLKRVSNLVVQEKILSKMVIPTAIQVGYFTSLSIFLNIY